MTYEISALPQRTTHDGKDGVLYWPRATGAQFAVHRLLVAQAALQRLQDPNPDPAWDEDPENGDAFDLRGKLEAEDVPLDADGARRWLEAYIATEGPKLRELPHFRLVPLTNGQIAHLRSRSTVLSSSFSVSVDEKGGGSAFMKRDPIQAELDHAREQVEANVPEAFNFVGREADGTVVPLRSARELLAFGDRSQAPIQNALIQELSAALQKGSILELGLGEAFAWPRGG